MLEALIVEIKRGGTVQPAVLAAKLNVSLGLVQAMLENLERMGMLTQMPASCSESCGGCAVSDGCSTQSHDQGRVWMLTTRSKATGACAEQGVTSGGL